MTRRTRIATALSALALGAVVATASPALADAAPPAPAPGYTLNSESFYQEICQAHGLAGESAHEWTNYYCVWIPMSNPDTGSGILGTAYLYVN